MVEFVRQQADCQFGWYAMEAVRAEQLRIGPSPAAPPVLDDGGNPVTVKGPTATHPGSRVGWQSEPNPHGSPYPQRAGAVDGYAPVYVHAGGKAGFLPADALREWHGPPFADGPQPASDAEHRDFQVAAPDPFPNRPRPHERKERIPGHAAGGARRIRPGRREVYARWANRGTFRRYLTGGDRVTRRYVGWHGHYTCVRVDSARWCEHGLFVWVESSSLQRFPRLRAAGARLAQRVRGRR